MVYPNYRLTYIKAIQTIDQQYDNLKELGNITRVALKFKYKYKYIIFINVLTGKHVIDLVKWTDTWLDKVTKVYTEGFKIDTFELVTDLERAF